MSDEYEGYPPDRDDTPSGLWVSLWSDDQFVATQPWIPGERITFAVSKTTLINKWELSGGDDSVAYGFFASPLIVNAGDTASISIEAEVNGR